MSDVKDVYVDKRTNIKKPIYDEHSYIVKIIKYNLKESEIVIYFSIWSRSNMSGNDEKTRWKFLWKQIYDRYLQKPLASSIYNPQTDPMDVLL